MALINLTSRIWSGVKRSLTGIENTRQIIAQRDESIVSTADIDNPWVATSVPSQSEIVNAHVIEATTQDSFDPFFEREIDTANSTVPSPKSNDFNPWTDTVVPETNFQKILYFVFKGTVNLAKLGIEVWASTPTRTSAPIDLKADSGPQAVVSSDGITADAFRPAYIGDLKVISPGSDEQGIIIR